jgi:hypothetical protein
VPRPDAITVELAVPALRRIRRLRLGAALFGPMLATLVCASSLIADLVGYAPKQPLEDQVTLDILVAIFMGVLPGFAAWRIIGRDLRVVRRLVQEGVAYRAELSNRAPLRYRAAISTVTWHDERKRRARVWLERIPRHTKRDAVLALVLPDCKLVAVVLGDAGVYIGTRTRW